MVETSDHDVLTFELEKLNSKWFYVVRRYGSDEEALAAFTKMNEYAARLKGKAEIAGYRLLDKPGGKGLIVAVMGMIEERVREAARMMGGVTQEMHPDHMRGLIMRRLRFLLAAGALEVEPGVHTFHHGRGGMFLDDKGRVVAPPEGVSDE